MTYDDMTTWEPPEGRKEIEWESKIERDVGGRELDCEIESLNSFKNITQDLNVKLSSISQKLFHNPYHNIRPGI